MKHLLDQAGSAKGAQNNALNSQSGRATAKPYSNDPYADVYLTHNELRKLAAGKIFRPRALL